MCKQGYVEQWGKHWYNSSTSSGWLVSDNVIEQLDTQGKNLSNKQYSNLTNKQEMIKTYYKIKHNKKTDIRFKGIQVSNFTIGIFASTCIVFQGAKALEDLRRVHALRQCRRRGRRRGALAQLLLRANTAWAAGKATAQTFTRWAPSSKWGGKTLHIIVRS